MKVKYYKIAGEQFRESLTDASTTAG